MESTGQRIPRMAFYSIPTPETPTTIGINKEAAAFSKTDEWNEFFAEGGYKTTEVTVEGGREDLNIAVEPPMSNEHIKQLADLARRCIESPYKTVHMSDHRHPPLRDWPGLL